MKALNLRSVRLAFVPLGPAHVQAAHSLWTEAEIREYLWDGEVISLERALDALHTSAADFRDCHFGLWGLQVRPAAELAGFCGLRRAALMPEPELLFGLRQAYWGCGLGFEAADTVLAYAFGPLELPVVGAATDVTNHRSIRLLERLGMSRIREAVVQALPTLFYGLTNTNRTRRADEHRGHRMAAGATAAHGQPL